MLIFLLNVTHLKGGYNVPNVYKYTEKNFKIKIRKLEHGVWMPNHIIQPKEKILESITLLFTFSILDLSQKIFFLNLSNIRFLSAAIGILKYNK